VDYLDAGWALIKEHYQWVFSGIGVMVVGALLARPKPQQQQKVGSRSVALQGGRDVKVNIDARESDQP
jgi:hypothetical protein